MKKNAENTAAHSRLSALRVVIAAALANATGATSTSDKHREQYEKLAAEVAHLEDSVDPDNARSVTSLAEKRTRLGLLQRRVEKAEQEGQTSTGARELRASLNGAEEIIRAVAYPRFEEHVEEVTRRFRPFYRDEASTMQAARSADSVTAWGPWFFSVAARCANPSHAEIQTLLGEIDSLLEGRSPFVFHSGVAAA